VIHNHNYQIPFWQ